MYHGFCVWPDVVVGGFIFGVITDFEETETDAGDAFIIAPDGSRAGLIWSISDAYYFEQACSFEKGRWGVWAVGFEGPMRTKEDARRNLARIVSDLREQWMRWNKLFGK